MALLDILTPEVIAERFYTLPENLQAILEDKDKQRTIQIACVMNGIGDPNELQNAEAIIAAVILGLTHMDDLKETLAENLLLDPQIAGKISAEVRDKVLEPIRKDIEKIYAPIMPAAIKISAPVTRTPTPAPAPMPIASTPATAPKMPAAPQAWQPTRLTVPAAPAPFMMHQESSATPLTTGSDFKLNIPKDIFKSAPAKTIDIPRPPKAAELEIGKAPLPPKLPANVSFRTMPAPQSRVVHYTDIQTSAVPGFGVARPPASTTPMVHPPEMPVVKPIATPAPIIAPPVSVAPTTPITPVLPTPPKVVNFGPEEVK